MQHRPGRFPFPSAAVALCCAVVLGGCAWSSKESMAETYTIEQARQDPIDVVTQTVDLLPSEHWASRAGGPWPAPCTLESGDEGASYSYTLYSEERSEDLHADAQLIANHWESLGMDVSIVAEDVVSPRVYATGGPVRRASFNTNDPGSGRYRVGATSWCAPGDGLELGLKENERREQREVIPGDDYFFDHPEDD